MNNVTSIHPPDHGDGGDPEVIVVEGVGELTEQLETLNAHLAAQAAEPEPERSSGWIWFLLGGLLGLSW